MDNKTSKTISRRGFICASTVALTGLTVVSGTAVSGLGHIAPGGKEVTAGEGGMMKTKSAELADSITDWWLRNDLYDPAGVFGNTPTRFAEGWRVSDGWEHRDDYRYRRLTSRSPTRIPLPATKQRTP
jgi:hypothetical protein